MAVTPIQSIREEFRKNPRAEPFDRLMQWHLNNGFVFSTPEFFVMGSEQNSRELKEGGWELIPSGFLDTWYVHSMAGDMSKAWDILPWELPFIAFERKEASGFRLTICKTDRMKRLSHAVPQKTVA